MGSGDTSGKIFQYKLVLLGKFLRLFFTVIKILVFFFVGESSVGKSSLVMRFVKDQFKENQDSTIGGGE